MGVSGEFRYFGTWSASIARPPNAITDPVSRQIGTISRLRKPIDHVAVVALNDQAALEQQALRESLLRAAVLLQAVARRRVAEAELLDRLRVDAALGELPPCAGAGGAGELLPKEGRGDLVDFEERLAQARVPLRIVARALGLLRDGDAELLREHAHGVLEADLLVKLEELEDVAADVAAEAVKEPFSGFDVERRRLLGVERTQALVGRARALQRHVLLDDLHDVRLQAQVVDELLRKETH